MSVSKFTLYRMFDSSGKLLYVGATGKSLQRVAAHSGKPWASEIASITFQKFASKYELLNAEKVAVQVESPIYNKCLTTLTISKRSIKMDAPKKRGFSGSQIVGIVKGEPADRIHALYKSVNLSKSILVSLAVGHGIATLEKRFR
jgi:excinuclease UvrABC nuclease subunit